MKLDKYVLRLIVFGAIMTQINFATGSLILALLVFYFILGNR